MSLCANCGLSLAGDSNLCPHHHMASGDDWHISNKIMCDFFHRGFIPERVPLSEREDEFWASSPDTA